MKAYSTSESYGMTAKPSSRYFCVGGQIRRKPWKEKVFGKLCSPFISPSLLFAPPYSVRGLTPADMVTRQPTC